MKKRILLLTLALCLLLAGCGKAPKKDEPSPEELESNEPMPGFDAQSKYLYFSTSFQEMDNFYIGSNNNEDYLHYYDRKSGISGFLCADPACGHDTKDCTAYIGTGQSLSYYDGKLYWVAQDPRGGREYYLWRSDLAGTNREKIKPVSFEEIMLVYAPQRYAIHRGKLYLMGHVDSVSGTQTGYRITLLSAPLDDSGEFTTLYDETLPHASSAIRFAGNYVYLSVVTVDTSVPDPIRSVTVTRFNINTNASEIVYEEKDITEGLGEFWVTPEGEVYLPGLDDKGVYVWKLEGGQRVEIASWEDEDPSPPTLMDGVAIHEYLKDGVRWLHVADYSGKAIYDGEMYPEKVEGLKGDPSTVGDYGYAISGGDTEKLIVHLMGFEVDENAALLLDLTDNMKATVLWTSEK